MAEKPQKKGRGGRRSTTWTKGSAPRNGGRKPLPYDLVAACREFTPYGISRLIEIAKMHEISPAIALDPQLIACQQRAIATLLDRGWGTAPQTLNIAADLSIKRIVLEDESA